MLAQMTPTSIPSTLFAHLSFSYVVSNACLTFPHSYSVFSPDQHWPKWANPSSSPTGLSMLNAFPSSVTPASPHLGRLENSHHYWRSPSLIAHGHQSPWLTEPVLWQDPGSPALFPSCSRTEPWVLLADAVMWRLPFPMFTLLDAPINSSCSEGRLYF